MSKDKKVVVENNKLNDGAPKVTIISEGKDNEVIVDTKQIGRVIQRARSNARLSQQKLGDMCGLSQQTIYKMEHGITMGFDSFIVVCLTLGLSIDKIVLGEFMRIGDDIDYNTLTHCDILRGAIAVKMRDVTDPVILKKILAIIKIMETDDLTIEL